MSEPLRFQCNTEKITHETIDGEVVIINLESGAYYSLDNSAARVWNFLEKGYSNKDMVKELECMFQGNSQEIENALDSFIQDLHGEDLIVPSDTAQNHLPESQSGNGAKVSNGDKPIFELPTFQKYTDMQELLLLDPIHEVDEAGWPHAKADHAEKGA